MKKNERLDACNILLTLLRDKRSLSQLMPSSSDISPMTKEICFGVCRHYFRLQAIILKLVEKKPKSSEVWVVLLMGIYQLHYMNHPDYAVVKETVDLLVKLKKIWAKGLVNAVLRQFCRQKENLLTTLQQDSDFQYGQAAWFLKRIQKDWPQDWQYIAASTDVHPPMVLRVNTMHHTATEYLALLDKADIKAQCHPIVPETIVLVKPCDVHQLPGFNEGWVSVQDAAAALAVSLLALKSGQRVLDACCAPGGKTCHILESTANQVICTALDVDAKRLERVKENLNRLGLQAKVIEGDALSPSTWWDGQQYDRILLDAPCSATGVIRRHADIKLLRTPDEVKEIAKLQQTLIESLWPLLVTGGILVYATCSIFPEENELQIATFVEAHPECRIIKENWTWGRTTEHGQQILPGDAGMDGFFYSVLQKG